jgi:hypothetical protein
MHGRSSRCDINTHHDLVSKNFETFTLRLVEIYSKRLNGHILSLSSSESSGEWVRICRHCLDGIRDR